MDLKAPGWVSEFRSFIMRGNVVDLAVGIIIGAAFTGVVTSLVKDVFNPVLGLLTGGVDFSNVFWALNGQHYAIAGGRPACRRADAEFRPVHQRHHPVHHRRLRGVLGGEAADPAARARGRQVAAPSRNSFSPRSATS